MIANAEKLQAERQPYYDARAAATPHGASQAAAVLAPGWQWYYAYGTDADLATNPRYQAGVLAYKGALVANGYTVGIVLALGVWGNYARDRCVQFQRAHSLADDGIVGPATAKALLRYQVLAWEAHYGIPEHLLGKQGSLESNNHVVAQGWADSGDEGWGQIHMAYHPDITLAQAWDPAYAIKWAAGQLWSNHANLGDYDAALAAYNVGYSTAKLWLAAGKVDHGGPVWHTPAGDVDSFTRAYTYVQAVRSQVY